jgi:hypothetical protein
VESAPNNQIRAKILEPVPGGADRVGAFVGEFGDASQRSVIVSHPRETGLPKPAS